MGERLREIQTVDGRTLGVAQWGDLDGAPLFALHGTPGSRLGRHPDESALQRMGARVITYDRPGYGASDRQPGRRVVDCVADVEAIANALGIERFAVTGASGGGPHALAVAARLSERVAGAECVVGVAPVDAAELDWLAGMDPENVKEFGWAAQGEAVLRRELEALAAQDLQRISVDPSKLLSDDWELAAADRHVLARKDVQQVMGEMVHEAYRTGVWGWVDDDLAFLKPWGFDVAEVDLPVVVRYGSKDVLVPPAHGAWLAAHLSNAHSIISDDAGHLVDPDTRLQEFAHLIALGAPHPDD